MLRRIVPVPYSLSWAECWHMIEVVIALQLAMTTKQSTWPCWLCYASSAFSFIMLVEGMFMLPHGYIFPESIVDGAGLMIFCLPVCQSYILVASAFDPPSTFPLSLAFLLWTNVLTLFAKIVLGVSIAILKLSKSQENVKWGLCLEGIDTILGVSKQVYVI